jgi:hypothetical protein
VSGIRDLSFQPGILRKGKRRNFCSKAGPGFKGMKGYAKIRPKAINITII